MGVVKQNQSIITFTAVYEEARKIWVCPKKPFLIFIVFKAN